MGRGSGSGTGFATAAWMAEAWEGPRLRAVLTAERSVRLGRRGRSRGSFAAVF